MALITSADGLVTAKTTIQTFQGIMELEFTNEGITRKITINSNKMADVPFTTQQGGSTNFRGFRLLGNAYAFSQTTADTNAALVLTDFTTETTVGTRTITNSVGKVDLDTDDVTKNIKNVGFLIGSAIANPLGSLSVEQGAVLFLSTTGTARTTSTAAVTGIDVIHGGTGTAMLVSGDIERVLRLDEVTYPFNIASTETLTPLGSSVILL